MESFLVYLYNFYYAISELEQNKQNNTILFFLTINFFNKKVDLSSLRGGAGAPIAPPSLRACGSIARVFTLPTRQELIKHEIPLATKHLNQSDIS